MSFPASPPVLPSPPSATVGFYLGGSESFHLEEADTACPGGQCLPLWVEGKAVEGLGTSVLEGQLATDHVPQLA